MKMEMIVVMETRVIDEPGSRLASRPEGLGLDAGEEWRTLLATIRSARVSRLLLERGARFSHH